MITNIFFVTNYLFNTTKITKHYFAWKYLILVTSH